MKVPLSSEERRKRFWQARRGWGYSKDMTRSEFLKIRDKSYQEKEKKEEAKMRKAAEKSRKAAASTSIQSQRSPASKWRGRAKILILAAVIAAVVYVYFMYLR